MSQDKLTRIAIVSSDKCKPKKCRQECRKSCPVVRMGKLPTWNIAERFSDRHFLSWLVLIGCKITILGKLCIEVTPTDKIAYISEDLCIGCGICAKVSANY